MVLVLIGLSGMFYLGLVYLITDRFTGVYAYFTNGETGLLLT